MKKLCAACLLLLSSCAGQAAEPTRAAPFALVQPAPVTPPAAAPPETEPQAGQAPKPRDCGDGCKAFSTSEAAFDYVLAETPRVLAVGEAHAQLEGPKAASATRRFMDGLLPRLAPRATDLVIELWLANGSCGKVEKKVQKQQQAVTAPQAASNQNEFMELGTRAKALDIQPHALVPSCEQYQKIAGAGAADIEEMLRMIKRVTQSDVQELLGKRAPDRLIVAYGGAMHNDLVPREDREDFSFGPELADATGGHYVELDLVIPEQIKDSEAWRNLPWYGQYSFKTTGTDAYFVQLGATRLCADLPQGLRRKRAVIYELSNTIQAYAWGSRTALAELRGEPSPSAGPEAELWMGAHPLAPSRASASQESLIDLIARAPEQQLGSQVVAQYGSKLPFLLKVLAAATPLSLQAHPSLSQAAAGFEADEAAGIPLDAPHRNYKDNNHKPELLCALTEFWALCGFREVEPTLALFAELAVSELAPYLQVLQSSPDESGLRSVFSSLMGAPADERRQLAERTAQACGTRLEQASPFAREYAWAVRIAELYPGDVGVVSALLLNLLRLEPGQAIYLPAGNLHAYLGGTGVEIMASSDNVLRGGLTPKHVNVPELLRVLDFRPLRTEPLRAVTEQQEHVFRTPAREFQLSYFDLTSAPRQASMRGPEIWLVTEGSARLLAADGTSLTLSASRSAFVPAATGRLELSGSGRIFRARVAHSE